MMTGKMIRGVAYGRARLLTRPTTGREAGPRPAKRLPALAVGLY